VKLLLILTYSKTIEIVSTLNFKHILRFVLKNVKNLNYAFIFLILETQRGTNSLLNSITAHYIIILLNTWYFLTTFKYFALQENPVCQKC